MDNQGNTGKKVILAVDNDAAQLKIFQEVLAEQYDVRGVGSASDALGFLKEVPVVVVLLEIDLPNISGLEFLHDMRKIPRYMNVPVIIVTGHTEPELLESARNSSAAGVLIKPVSSQTLIEAIEKALTTSSQGPHRM